MENFHQKINLDISAVFCHRQVMQGAVWIFLACLISIVSIYRTCSMKNEIQIEMKNYHIAIAANGTVSLHISEDFELLVSI